MSDLILSGFLSLFALFGKEEQVDEAWAKTMLANYLHHYFGIRNADEYLDYYSDVRLAYETTNGLSTKQVVKDISLNLADRISNKEKSLLLLRLMEFCNSKSSGTHDIFRTVAETFGIPEERFRDFEDYVGEGQSERVHMFKLRNTDGYVKTLYYAESGLLIFTYQGHDTVKLNDVNVLPGVFQIWLQSSVLKGNDGRPLYYSTIVATYNKSDEESTQGVEFCGRDINFRFPNSNNGLHHLSFTLKSGELLAVMGGSGTGKSTLLSILSGIIRPQQGSITINGHDIKEPAAESLIGFVPQDDLLIEELTVYQNLWYTAKLCFEGMSTGETDRRIIRILKDLDLFAVKDLKVGSPINKLISGGQRKRLNIALELIREPAVLFLDEPTSGLSSADAEKVIYLLKEQTYKGRLVVVNIHQPTSDVYKLFDRLWILDRGGYPVFDGNPIDAITYFKRTAGYADAETSACPTCGNVNPEVMLNIIEEKTLNSSGEPTAERKMKPEEWHELYLQNQPSTLNPPPSTLHLPPSNQRRPGKLKQAAIFLSRNVRTKAANLQYLCIMLLVAPLLAIVCAMLTRYAPEEGYSVMNNKNLVSYFFMAVIVATFVGMSTSAEEIIRDRMLLKRERFLRLSYASYISSKIVYTAGVSLLQTLLFVLVGNTVMGLQGLFWNWWLVLFVTSLLANLTGLLLSQCLSSVVAIYVSIPLLLIPQILLCGLVVSFSDLTPKSTTGNVPLIGNIIPSRWAYEALAVSSFADNPYEQSFFETDRQKYEAQYYNMGFLYTLQEHLETMEDERRQGRQPKADHIEIIRTNLPELAGFCEMEPYAGDYSYGSLKSYMEKAGHLLSERSNKTTLRADAIMTRLLRKIGKEEVLRLKSDNYNLRLEEIVTGADNKRLLDIVDHHIVARVYPIFLSPRSQAGQAPFYSSEKIVGGLHVKTLWFNIGIMLLMAAVVAILLYTDCPGRYVRQWNMKH